MDNEPASQPTIEITHRFPADPEANNIGHYTVTVFPLTPLGLQDVIDIMTDFVNDEWQWYTHYPLPHNQSIYATVVI